jgi:hypothetical protein
MVVEPQAVAVDERRARRWLLAALLLSMTLGAKRKPATIDWRRGSVERVGLPNASRAASLFRWSHATAPAGFMHPAATSQTPLDDMDRPLPAAPTPRYPPTANLPHRESEFFDSRRPLPERPGRVEQPQRAVVAAASRSLARWYAGRSLSRATYALRSGETSSGKPALSGIDREVVMRTSATPNRAPTR